jgi:poly(3-hydroxybutyrate) depolymerase
MPPARALAGLLLLSAATTFVRGGSEWESKYGKSSGCGAQPPYNPSDPNDSLYVDVEIDGIQRGYLLHIPTTYDPNRPTPLVFSFHGWSCSSQSNREWMGFTSNMQAENYVVVYPDGKRDCLGQSNCWSSWNAGGASFNGDSGPGPNGGWTCAQSTGNCQACADSCQPLGVCNSDNFRSCNWATCVDDVSFVDQILDKLEGQLCVDRARIFASGESMGGIMAWQLATSLPHRFAAVAPTVGAPHEGWTETPSSNEQISVLNLHARSDCVVPPGGGQSCDGWFFDSVNTLMTLWGDYNSCSGVPPPSKTFPTLPLSTRRLSPCYASHLATLSLSHRRESVVAKSRRIRTRQRQYGVHTGAHPPDTGH